jgi:hypothetical protein
MDTTTEPPAGAPLRLTIELVPETCWYSNMRALLPSAEWDRLRRQVYRDYSHRCGICGASGRLHCHEIWRYDDAAHVQRLEGYIALCSWCHHVKHIGLAKLLAARGELDFERVVTHFLRVNGCDRATFERHCADAFALWRERSRHAWRTELLPGYAI